MPHQTISVFANLHRIFGRGLARRLAIALLGVFAAPLATAGWMLDGERSALQFMSVKNMHIAEIHHFKALSGSIDDAGQARVVIDLESVETLIPIRNQRMRELLFETLRFPAATLTARAPAGIQSLVAGETLSAEMTVGVNLHGIVAPYQTRIHATRLADGGVQVTLAQPVLVRATDFALTEGIEALRKIVGLQSISTAVPVTATLVFVADGG